MLNEVAPPLTSKDETSLGAWLSVRPRQVRMIITARAALRALPMYSRYARFERDLQFAEFAGSLFRATALARLAAKYPTHADELRAGANAAAIAAHVAAHAAASATFAAHAAARAAGLTTTADLVHVSAAFFAEGAAHAAASAADLTATRAIFFAGAPDVAAAAGDADAAAEAWEAVSRDANLLTEGDSVAALADRPLWPQGTPCKAADAWAELTRALPADQDWGVWTRWYEERLTGAVCDEPHEIVFATVPVEVWDQGPAAANKWIRKHLPTAPPEIP